MTTDSKTQANQANAQYSTGPRTEAGKGISSMNAIKHGLTALTVLIPGEDPIVYECFYAGMLEAFEPLNTPEIALIQELTDVQWRLRRASKSEAAIQSAETPDLKALNNVGTYTARLKRQYSATLKEFNQMHRLNKAEREKQMEEAEIVYRADLIKQRPSTLDEYGFDFTIEDVRNATLRKRNLEKNKNIVENYEDGIDDDEDDDEDVTDGYLDDAA